MSDRDEIAAWLMTVVLPLIALYQLAAGPSAIHRLVQVVCAVCLVVASHGTTTRYARMTVLILVTVGLLLLGVGWASPVLPLCLLGMAVVAKGLAARFP